MVQMALQEIICNGVETENVQLNGDHNIPKYVESNHEKEANGLELENNGLENSETNVLNLEKQFNIKCESPTKNDISCLHDESSVVFSSSSLLTENLDEMVERKNNVIEDVSISPSPVNDEDAFLKEHNCLLHPTHVSLNNKLDASKNTIFTLEETINRLEKQLSIETSRAEKVLQLERIIIQYEKEIQLSKQEHELDQRTIVSLKKEMETKLSAMKKQYETANKEKESMVMRYAVSEKELLDCKKEKDNIDKKMKDILKENELSSTKLKTITNEKIKLSQQLDNKTVEVSNTYKEIDKLKEEINSRDIKIKWTQNKLKSEMDVHKECPILIDRLNSNIKTLQSEIDKYRQEIANLKVQLQDYKSSENKLKDQACISEQPNILELISAEKILQSEYDTLVMENNLISKQVENVEQIWLSLDSGSLNQSAEKPTDSSRNESLTSLLKETERILSEVNQIRNSNKILLSDISKCHAKGAELLSLSPIKVATNNKDLKSNTPSLEYKTGLINEAGGDNEPFTNELRNRIDSLEKQLAEEKQIKEDTVKSFASAEQILTEVDKLRCSNEELMSDISSCKAREAELLAFTQKLTSKNVKLQSDFTDIELKANQLELSEQSHIATVLQLKNDVEKLQKNLNEEKDRRQEETRLLARQVAEKTTKAESLLEGVSTLQSELSLIRNKHAVQVKELQRELSQYKRRIEQLESTTGGAGNTESITNSLTSGGSKSSNSSLSSLNDSPIIQGIDVPAQVLVERIVKLQQESAKHNDKIEFLEEHTAQLVKELQKKSRLLQSYILREQTGTLTSNSMDRSKAELTKSGGIMASLYGSKAADETMTFELCLEINRKLQAVLEDTLLKNITLKENIDTLGDEIARLSQKK